MKIFKLVLLFVLIGGLSEESISQSFGFNNQAEIDAFDTSITEISGGVIIWGNDIYDLSNLSNLRSIARGLRITHNDNLASLAGLSSLEYIGGDLVVEDNDKLISLSSLFNVVTFGGSLEVKGNKKLISLQGLAGIDSLRSLAIEDNISLTDVLNLVNLVDVSGDMSISNNKKLRNLNGLSRLGSCGGKCQIEFNENLTNIDSLHNLTFIGEDFYLRGNYMLNSVDGLTGLDTIGGSLELFALRSLSDIDGFSNLSFVGGYIEIKSLNNINDIKGLNQLSFLGDDFVIKNNDALKDIGSFLNLHSIGGRLEFYFNDSIPNINGFSYLDSIKGSIILNGNKSLHHIDGLSNLSYLGRNLSIGNSGPMENIDALSNLTSINGHIRIAVCSALTSINGLSNIDRVEDYIYISNCKELKELDGLSSLTRVGSSLKIRNNKKLENIDGLSDVIFVGEEIEITENDLLVNLDGLVKINKAYNSLIIKGNNSLKHLDGLSGITTIDGSLELLENNSLVNIDGLSALLSIGVNMNISENSNLTNINGLSNVQRVNNSLTIEENESLQNLDGLSHIMNIGGQLTILNNGALTDCCGIHYLLSTADAIDGYVYISYNPFECSSGENILASCDGVGLSGTVYFDDNQNKIQDFNEYGIANLDIISEDFNYKLLTRTDGRFRYYPDSGQVFTVTLPDIEGWNLTTDTSSFHITFDPDNLGNDKYDFGLSPDFFKHLLKLNLSNNPVRCDEEVDFHLRIANAGTHPETGMYIMTYDSSSTYIDAYPSPTDIDIVNHTITWSLDSIYPFQIENARITLLMPDFNSLGDIVKFNVSSYRDHLSELVLSDSYDLSFELLCAYDPNDKRVSPPGEQEQHYTLKDDLLTYTIRFQNTGNIEAADISILDTLDIHLDMHKFKIVNSSHDVQALIKDHSVNFLFKNINLPDSVHNEIESHGYVTYEIGLLGDVPDNLLIKNTANIIFDSNPAVITNTTLNTMVETIPWVDATRNYMVIPYLDIVPNPAQDRVRIVLDKNHSMGKVYICNVLGKIELSTDTRTIDISRLPQGLYLLQTEIDGIRIVKKFVIEK